ncbi:unnamed protein product [Onchocerca flexuosa]|uniref:Conserved domain protein n=1 Tax=Onchocerca flexuosa TaxID=387005 RepID=A0A183HG00_9BILA|nr:unnamed protein product [Onchocerca flexuosa]
MTVMLVYQMIKRIIFSDADDDNTGICSERDDILVFDINDPIKKRGNKSFDINDDKIIG